MSKTANYGIQINHQLTASIECADEVVIEHGYKSVTFKLKGDVIGHFIDYLFFYRIGINDEETN